MNLFSLMKTFAFGFLLIGQMACAMAKDTDEISDSQSITKEKSDLKKKELYQMWRHRDQKIQSAYFEWERKLVYTMVYLELREWENQAALDDAPVTPETIEWFKERYAGETVKVEQTHKMWLDGERYHYLVEGNWVAGIRDREAKPTIRTITYDGKQFYRFSNNPTLGPYTNARFEKPSFSEMRTLGAEPLMHCVLPVKLSTKRLSQYEFMKLNHNSEYGDCVVFHRRHPFGSSKYKGPEDWYDVSKGGVLTRKTNYRHNEQGSQLVRELTCQYQYHSQQKTWLPKEWHYQEKDSTGDVGVNEHSKLLKIDFNPSIEEQRFEIKVPDSAFVWYSDGSGRELRKPLVVLEDIEKSKDE